MQFSQISYQTRSFPFLIFETSAIPSPMLPAGVGAPAQCPTARPPPPAPPSRVPLTDRRPVTAALRYRYTGPVWPVTGGNQLNSNPNSNKFKNSHTTGSDRFTGRFDRFTGRFDRFEIQNLPCNRFTGRFDRFTGRFDRFDWWAFMGRPIFLLFLF